MSDLTRGERVRLFRLALGYDVAADFARLIGVTTQQLNNWEARNSGPGWPTALEVSRRYPRLKFRWIMEADPDGIPDDVLRRMYEILEAESAQERAG